MELDKGKGRAPSAEEVGKENGVVEGHSIDAANHVHPISFAIRQFFEAYKPIFKRPGLEVDPQEQLKSRTWLFFAVLLQLCANIAYSLVVTRVSSSTAITVIAGLLLLYWVIKLISVGFYLVLNPSVVYSTFFCCSLPQHDDTYAFIFVTLTIERIMIFIPVYNEGKKSLKHLIESIYNSHYPKNKLYMTFVVDGNSRKTFDNLMNELQVPSYGPLEPQQCNLRDGVYKDQIPYSVILKEQCRGKRDSTWIFVEILRNLPLECKPQFVMFLESDTHLRPDTIMVLARKLRDNASAAGVCGKLEISNFEKMDHKWDNVIFNLTTMVIVGFQHYEYHFQQVFGKQVESLFGSVSTLPGAASMYQASILEAIQLPPEAAKKLSSKQSITVKDYMPSDFFSKATKGVYARNKYELGGDTALTQSLLSRGYKCLYEPNAVALTRCPNTIVELVEQRKRWNNSTFVNLFSQLTTLSLWFRPRTIVLMGLAAIDFVSMYIMPANAMLMLSHVWAPGFTFLQDWLSPSLHPHQVLFWWILLQLLIVSTTHMQTADMFFVISCSFASLSMAGAAFFFIRDTWIPMIQLNTGDWGIMVLLLLFPLLHMLVIVPKPTVALSVISYWLMLPTVAITIPLYSFLHLDDYTWGTR